MELGSLIGKWKTRSGHYTDLDIYYPENKTYSGLVYNKELKLISRYYYDGKGNSLINDGLDLMERFHGNTQDLWPIK